MSDRRDYVVFRPDLLVVHTKPITEGRARWLLEKAYYSFVNTDVRAKYLAQWGNVLDLTGDKGWISWWGLGRMWTGVYASGEDLIAKVAETLNDDILEKDTDWLRRRLKYLIGELDEFIRRPVDPRPLERRPRPPVPLIRFVKMSRPHLRWNRRDVEYLVPKPEWYVYENHDGAYYGISAFSGTYWLWMQQYPIKSVDALIVRRDASPDEILVALANDANAVDFLKTHGEHFLRVINDKEDDIKKAGYGDVVDLVKSIMVAASLVT